MKVFLLALAFITITTQSAYSQTRYTLSECIAIARENNITAQQAKLSAQQSNVSYKSASYARLPNLNASMSNNLNFGRTIDPFSNTFTNQGVTASSVNLSSSVTLFNGFRLKNNQESSEHSKWASELNLAVINNNIALDVAALYLSVLMTTEQLKTYENNIAQTKEQLKRTNILIEAGAATINTRLELEAQLANDELQLINAQNNRKLAVLNLKIYMNLPGEQDFDVAPVENLTADASEVEDLILQEIITSNQLQLPEVKRDELLLNASEYSLKAAKGSLMPTLNLSAGLNSIYSSRSKQPSNGRTEIFPIGYVDGTNTTVYSQQQVFDYNTPNFFEQMNNNFGQTFNLSLSVPIFNRNQISAGIENASINNQQQYLQLQSTKNQIENNIYQAYLNLEAAKKSFAATEKAYNAQKALLEQTEIRYQSGAATYFEYTAARNSYTTAEVNFMRAKYDLIFKEKTFGFYLGHKIDL